VIVEVLRVFYRHGAQHLLTEPPLPPPESCKTSPFTMPRPPPPSRPHPRSSLPPSGSTPIPRLPQRTTSRSHSATRSRKTPPHPLPLSHPPAPNPHTATVPVHMCGPNRLKGYIAPPRVRTRRFSLPFSGLVLPVGWVEVATVFREDMGRTSHQWQFSW